MRIAVHDYSGHPFQLQLSRELAARGHDVLHLYCASVPTGRGAVALKPDDSASFAVEPIDLGDTFARYSPVTRVRQERRYGRLVADRVERFRPDVVLSANTPLLAQHLLQRRVRALGARFVFWLQDIHAVALESIGRAKVPLIGAGLGRAIGRVERVQLRRSDHVVVITDDFLDILQRWGVDSDDVTVIENWAPLGELGGAVAESSGWASAHGLDGRTVLLYSGTLGLKHNPSLLLALARSLDDRDDVRLVVISEGLGADWLRGRTAEDPAPGLVVLPFQPYEVFPEVLATADVVIAILEPEAGVFSVPSKVLSYHCAGRPILAAIPPQNLAARIITMNQTGVVVDPDDEHSFVCAAHDLLADPARCDAIGRRASAYAAATFDIEKIADRFERLLAGESAHMPTDHLTAHAGST